MNCDCDTQHSGWNVFQGIAFVLLGSVAITAPFLFSIGIELLLGWLLLFAGLILGYRTLKTKDAFGFVASIIAAVSYFVVGALLLFYPIQSLVTLTVLFAIFFLIQGGAELIFSLVHRNRAGWWWTLLGGIASIVLAGLIWKDWPQSVHWLVGLLFGINMILYGVGFILGSTSCCTTEKK
jgi:Uncharacterized conserved protein